MTEPKAQIVAARKGPGLPIEILIYRQGVPENVFKISPAYALELAEALTGFATKRILELSDKAPMGRKAFIDPNYI